MAKSALPLILAALLSVGCAGDGSSVLGGFKALESCDYGDNCAQAVAKALTLNDSSPELRARLLHIRMNALMKFPAADEKFLQAVGVRRDLGYKGLGLELRELAAHPDGEGRVLADQAGQVIDFLGQPTCERFSELEALQNSRSLFADSAAIARISGLIQLLSSVTPENSSYVAAAMRQMVGCSMSPRADGGAVMVATKTMLVDALAACPSGEGGDAVLRSVCEQGRAILSELRLPLPMIEARSGELAQALLPSGRSIGMSMNPPWMISLSAGRLMVVDQQVVSPDTMVVPDSSPTMMLDLRQPHRQADIKTALHQVLKTRKLYSKPGDERTSWIFMVVDKKTTFADLADVMAGFMSETDALPLIAVLPAGGTRALWVPLNFFIRTRPLHAPDGTMSSWAAPGDGKPGVKPAELALSPFSLQAGSGTVEFDRNPGMAANGLPDLREVNRLALKLKADGVPGSYGLKVAAPVTFDLLLGVIQSLAYRMPESAMASPGAFMSSQEVRRTVGGYEYLLGWAVLDRD